jgi:hypothetical protein
VAIEVQTYAMERLRAAAAAQASAAPAGAAAGSAPEPHPERALEPALQPDEGDAVSPPRRERLHAAVASRAIIEID